MFKFLERLKGMNRQCCTRPTVQFTMAVMGFWSLLEVCGSFWLVDCGITGITFGNYNRPMENWSTLPVNCTSPLDHYTIGLFNDLNFRHYWIMYIWSDIYPDYEWSLLKFDWKCLTIRHLDNYTEHWKTVSNSSWYCVWYILSCILFDNIILWLIKFHKIYIRCSLMIW